MSRRVSLAAPPIHTLIATPPPPVRNERMSLALPPVIPRRRRYPRIRQGQVNSLRQAINATERIVRNFYGASYNNVFNKLRNFTRANNRSIRARGKNVLNAYDRIPGPTALTPRQKSIIISNLVQTNNWKRLPDHRKKQIKNALAVPLNDDTKLRSVGRILDMLSIYSPRYANALQNAIENYGLRQELGRFAFLRHVGAVRNIARGRVGGARDRARAERLG